MFSGFWAIADYIMTGVLCLLGQWTAAVLFICRLLWYILSMKNIVQGWCFLSSIVCPLSKFLDNETVYFWYEVNLPDNSCQEKILHKAWIVKWRPLKMWSCLVKYNTRVTVELEDKQLPLSKRILLRRQIHLDICYKSRDYSHWPPAPFEYHNKIDIGAQRFFLMAMMKMIGGSRLEW